MNAAEEMAMRLQRRVQELEAENALLRERLNYVNARLQKERKRSASGALINHIVNQEIPW